MFSKPSWLGFPALLFMLACSTKEDPPPQEPATTYYIANNNATQGNLSTYAKPGDLLTPNSYQPEVYPSSNREQIADMELNEGKLYLVRTEASTVDILDASSQARLSSIEFTTYYSGYKGRRLAVAGTHVFVSGYDNNHAYLHRINLSNPSQIDSIPSPQQGSVAWTMAYAGNKLFVGWRGPGEENSIVAVDPVSYDTLGTFSLGAYFCYDMMVDRDGNLLAFTTSDSLLLIDPTNLELKSKRELLRSSLFVTDGDKPTNRSAYGLDKPRNMMYFLVNAPQPASAPYLLYSYDLTNSRATMLSSKFIDAATIAFDPVHQTILLGSNALILIYDVRARKLGEFAVPMRADEILVKY